MREGSVALVGAGPGDPDLVTMKAARLMREADVVVFDRLVSDEILAMIPAGTARIYAGKAMAHHALVQDEINELLVSLARAGRRVLRLKGGDPFVFGRGSEEAEHLARHGIPFEVVPGISSASGCATYSGIPLTHRGLSQGVRFLAGHAREGYGIDYDWHRLADPDTTLVIYMGLTNLPRIADELMAAGLPSDTPAAAIENGTTARQRRAIGTVASLPVLVTEQEFKAPTLIVIGRVVSLAGALDWFGSEPASAETTTQAGE
ncbi:MAG: uroporphyrinogen-III C-methyltransferase [Magnetospirillum sp.]|nr:uroporphyrinogen-III C-methyltransferase [Magnetospirillum sp.]